MPAYAVLPDGSGYDPNGTRGPITRDTLFDIVTVVLHDEEVRVLDVYCYLSTDPNKRIRRAKAVETDVLSWDHWSRDDPENAEILRRIADGSAEVRYSVLAEDTWQGRPIEELHEQEWAAFYGHPFDVYHRSKILLELGKAMRHFTPGTDGGPPTISFDAIFPDLRKRTYYARNDSIKLASPVIRSGAQDPGAVELGGLWKAEIPLGPERLHAVDVITLNDSVVEVSDTRRIWRRPNLQARIRTLARAFHAWETGLTTAERGTAQRAKTIEYWKNAIGRCWDAIPMSSDIRVYPGATTTAVTRKAEDVEDWYLGNLEFWHDRGFEDFASRLDRSYLQPRLDDYSFVHIALNGRPGDILINPGAGITAAQWAAFSAANYDAALGTVVTAEAGAGTLIAGTTGQTWTLRGASTVVNPSGPTTYSWRRVSGEGGTLSADDVAQPVYTPPILAAGDGLREIIFELTVCNNHECDTDTVTLTVVAPGG